ncbi:MAG TPA: phenylalanine--tRNA ligase subunit alpha [Candidatus Angelobacter sp.]|jgi:phenylalanyl-tRNA synthetase alpha chain|nr:phenylalanine--tRNA ligase subunit alpha [Candidatus Angelobacter sp.]
MIKKIKEIQKEASGFQAVKLQDIEDFRIKYLGKNGLIPTLFGELKNLSKTEKKRFGGNINLLKSIVLDIIQKNKKELSEEEKKSEEMDFTLPGYSWELGARHPISKVKNKIVKIFERIGFLLCKGPEIEDDWHNFTALNFPEQHPAREMQDTFFIEKNTDILLRTHTSSVQIRYMKNNPPPIRIISNGRVYRNEVISSHSHCMFHQIEGLFVDKGVSFADLKQTIQYLKHSIFVNSKIRVRPSYFPFTAPSAEIDIQLSSNGPWLEVLGCGLVNPKVLKNVGIDPEVYSGFAFGIGIERIALLLYQINDIRLYFDNDLRFLPQFRSE